MARGQIVAIYDATDATVAAIGSSMTVGAT